MISFVFILSLAVAAAQIYQPDCTKPTYQNGLGFVQGLECQLYYMCIKKANFRSLVDTPGVGHNDLYIWYPFCCAEGLAWDYEHLTCKRDGHCADPRDNCPNITTTTNTPCHHQADPTDETMFITSTGEHMPCPYDQVWNQEYCTCIFTGVHEAPCKKILHYNFTGSYDSDSCNNFAVGVPYGNISLQGNMLCLNGEDQFLSIPFLNNWFAWNPIGKTFTLCFWMRVKPEQSAGVFSSNADQNKVSLMDIWLDEGELIGDLAGNIVATGEYPSYDYWGKVCIVYNRGHFLFYFNALPCGEAEMPNDMPFNSHSDATVGYVQGRSELDGYVDDVCFWTDALSEEEVVECFNDGPSNDQPFGTPP